MRVLATAARRTGRTAPSPSAARMRSRCSSPRPPATSAYDDVSGDPAARVAAALDARVAQDLRRAARRARPRPSAAVPPRHARPRPLERPRPTDERVRGFARRRRPGARGAVLPVRPLPADRQLAAGHAAGQPAGHLERQHVAAVGQQVHDQHQHRDELLAGGVHEPRRAMEPLTAMVPDLAVTGARTARDDVRRPRLGGASQHRPVARHRADRRPAVGHVADRRRVAALHLWDHYEYTRRPRLPPHHLSDAEGRRRSSSSTRWSRIRAAAGSSPPRRSRRRTRIRSARRSSPGPTMDSRSCATCSRTCVTAAEMLGVDRRSAGEVDGHARAARAEPDRQRRTAAGMARGLGHAGAGAATTATSRICTGSFRGTRSTSAARRSWRPRLDAVAGDARRSGHRLGDGLADQPVGAAAATATTPTTS